MLRLTAVFLLFGLSALAQGTVGTLRCSINNGLDVHASRDPGSSVVARIQCGSPILLVDDRFGSAHIRTEDGKDGYIIGLNLGQWSIEPEKTAAPVQAQPQVAVTPAARTQVPRGTVTPNFPRVEVFGGFSFLRPNIPSDILGGSDGIAASNAGEFILGNVIGWGASGTVYLTRSFGLTGDASGHYRRLGTVTFEDISVDADLSLHAFLGGPTFKARLAHVEPFAHALFGIGKASASGTLQEGRTVTREHFSDSAMVMGIGGGLDVPVGKSISLRPIEADYFPYRTSNGSTFTFNNFRWRTGVVFRW